MAGREREVCVTVLGDSTSAERALASVGDASDKAGSKLEDFGAKVGPKMVAAGAAAGAAGVYLTKLADEGKIATAQLRTAIENAGGSYDELAPRIGKVSDRLIKLGFDDEATARSLATLTTATQDPAKALDSMGLAADIAASRHISLESASDKLAKAYSGNVKVLKEFGINLSANATAEERAAAMTELQARVQGQAAAQADNFGTKMESLKIRAENVAEAIGAKVGPALTIAGPLMAGLGGILSSGLLPALASGVTAAAGFAVSMVSAGLSAAAAAIPVMIAWAPVILGVAAIAAAAYLLYENWGTVWGFIKDIASTAFSWIKEHLDLIAMVVLAPIAPLILLVTHWDEAWTFVKNIAGAAWDWLKETIGGGIEAVVGFVASLPGRAWDALSNLGGMIVDQAAGAMNWLKDTIGGALDDVVSFVRGMPGRIRSAAAGMWDGISGAFKSAINMIIRGWNSIQFRIPGFSVGPISFGGFTLGLPNIPYLAKGGIATTAGLAIVGEKGPELAFLSKGAGIAPLSSLGARSGRQGELDTKVLVEALSTALRPLLDQLRRPDVSVAVTEKVDPLHLAREIAWAMG